MMSLSLHKQTANHNRVAVQDLTLGGRGGDFVDGGIENHFITCFGHIFIKIMLKIN